MLLYGWFKLLCWCKAEGKSSDGAPWWPLLQKETCGAWKCLVGSSSYPHLFYWPFGALRIREHSSAVGVSLIDVHFWTRLACPWKRRAFSYHTQSACNKYALSSLKQRFTNYFYRIPWEQQVLGTAVWVKTRADLTLCQLVYYSK